MTPPVPDSGAPWAQRLVKAAADAVAEEIRRHLAGEVPTGGHGYYAEGHVAAVAVLHVLSQRPEPWDRHEMADIADELRGRR